MTGLTMEGLIKQLILRGFRKYGLREGLEQWENGYTGRVLDGDGKVFERFAWLTDEGQEVSVEIAIRHVQIADDQWELEYIID
jgi:hypothetical protein